MRVDALSTWRWVGFGVPTLIALGIAVDSVLDMQLRTSRSGYEALAFAGYAFVGVGLTLAWLGAGALVARLAGPARAASSFAAGAGVALGAVLLIFTVSCFTFAW